MGARPYDSWVDQRRKIHVLWTAIYQIITRGKLNQPINVVVELYWFHLKGCWAFRCTVSSTSVNSLLDFDGLMEVTNNQNTLAFDCKHNILHFSHTFHLKRRTNVTRSVFYLLHNLSHHKRRSTNHRGSVLCIASEGWGFASFQHWAGWARTKFLINASYMIMFRPWPCKRQ